MAKNPYDTTNTIYSSSPPTEPDDISLFLQQFFLHSSSSTSSFPHQSLANHTPAENQEPAMFHMPGRIYFPDPDSGWFPANVPSSSSVGTLENDPYDCDCDSEEGFEAVVEEAVLKSMQGRSSAKRSRAAEVHNLSEKRRRSRINEKMKALQKLIPNSNKSDKASMLDEAIEYLKQLQLQVQMLTMRNGLSRYPFCLPGIVHPSISMDQDTSPDNLLLNRLLQNNYPTNLADFSSMVDPKASTQIESSVPNHFGPFQFSRSSTGICPEEVIPRQQLNHECSHSTSIGTKSMSSIPLDTLPSKSNDNTLEACFNSGDYLGGGAQHSAEFA